MIGAAPSFSVSEFVAVFNQSLEITYPEVVIAGEIANFKISKGKWVYFDLKDETASVRFFGSVFNLPGPLEDGMICEVHGRPRLHQQFGFSIGVNSVRAVGEGSIKKAQKLLQVKLEKEGLLALERKRGLPYPPKRIGLITSSESAAYADFNKIIAARWPSLKINLIDTLVQGAQAPAEIIKAIQEFNLASKPPEVLVIIRGGGSADDLAAFSEESVVRAVSASRVPTLVAIGHENDISLSELAADKRASTPSNAAELLVPDISHELQALSSLNKQIEESVRLVFRREQTFLTERTDRLNHLIKAILNNSAVSIDNFKKLLSLLDPLQPLQKGYILVRDSDGRQIKKSADMKPLNGLFNLEFIDGQNQVKLIKKSNKIVQEGSS